MVRSGLFYRPLTTSRVALNNNNHNKETNQDNGTNSEETPRQGVKDPGTETHGYDPTKPRKPMSRISLGGESKSINHARGKKQATQGLLSWKSALMFLATGGILTYFFNEEKKRLDMQRESEAHKGIGKPKVGGPFDLVDQDGNKFTDQDLLGKWSLIYFGFSMCPDICPDELDKMALVLDDINTKKDDKTLKPVFITCDPHRDTPDVLKRYLEEFHPDIIGLTGSYDDIKQTCKYYRVYFSTPPDLKPGQDYLVDHSIFFYLMDPQGKFVDALGRNYTAEETASVIKSHMNEWKPESQ